MCNIVETVFPIGLLVGWRDSTSSLSLSLYLHTTAAWHVIFTFASMNRLTMIISAFLFNELLRCMHLYHEAMYLEWLLLVCVMICTQKSVFFLACYCYAMCHDIPWLSFFELHIDMLYMYAYDYYLQSLRSTMNSPTSLIVVGGGDDLVSFYLKINDAT